MQHPTRNLFALAREDTDYLSPKLWAILSYLFQNRERMIEREQLVERFFSRENATRKSQPELILYWYIWYLRRWRRDSGFAIETGYRVEHPVAGYRLVKRRTPP
jgi:DNA-binding winged helix-turn-helix (wHTH) protein